ncbi:MAG TPA: delta-60 repeat domain-containing protein [Streptosporangiaceae bacterium]|nr:delta-60 repeat domain-containing protein [Streptosporangiaceae bacterium]
MRDPRTIIAGIGLAVMAAGGVTAVSAGGSPAGRAPSARTAAATVRTAPAAAGRTTGAILVKAQAAAASTPGSLDPTFGNGGKVLTPGGGVTDAILQPNGDIVVSTGSGVARFLPTGKLDTTFGSGGSASAGFTGGEGLQGIALQPDGKIIWVGSQNTPGFPAFGTFSFAVARFTANGTLDSSFGTGGHASVEFFAPPMQGAQEFARAVLVQPDGKILVAGSARQGQIRFAPIQGAIARLNANGTLDTSFGTGGTVLSASLPNGITALGLDAAGNIFTLPIRAEFSPAGQADANVTPAPITASSAGGSSVFLPSGQFVLANGVEVARHDDDIQVQRFNADGSLASASPAFDYSGAAGLDQARDSAGAVAVQANGQAVVGGAHFLSTSLIGLGRVNPDGTLDAGFGNGGVLTTTINGNEAVQAILIQPDGKILAVGNSAINATGQSFIVIARYLP